MRTSIRLKAKYGVVVFVSCLMGLGTLASAKDDAKLVFSVIGDIPYSKKEVKILKRHVEEHNLYSPSEFFVHVGDMRGTNSKCKAQEYEEVSEILRDLRVPTYVIPGDNEWNDCKKPKEAWEYWSQNFYNFEKNFCGAPKTARQSVRPENFAFVKKGVLLIGINMVAGSSDNNKKQRLKDNVVWVEELFKTHGDDVRAAVIFGHAIRGSDKDFRKPFQKLVLEFAKPVLYVQGNEHSYSYREKYLEANLSKVIVDKGRSKPPRRSIQRS